MVRHKLYKKENKPVSFSPEVLEKVHALIRRYPPGKQKSALLMVLHIAQEELGGYLTVDIMDYVAFLLDLQPIEVYEVATFYSMFHLEPVGKYVIEVCRTSPCAITGGENILQYLQEKLGIKTGETTANGLFTLKAVECLGACGNAPVMQVNTEFYENLTKDKIDRILEEMEKKANQESIPEKRWVKIFY